MLAGLKHDNQVGELVDFLLVGKSLVLILRLIVSSRDVYLFVVSVREVLKNTHDNLRIYPSQSVGL